MARNALRPQRPLRRENARSVTRNVPIRWNLSHGDIFLVAAIFAATLIYHVDPTPHRQHPLATPFVDMLATSTFAATIYLALRLLPTPGMLAKGLMAAHAGIWLGASGVHLMLTSGDVHFLPLLMPLDYPLGLLFGWIFFLADSTRPGPETDSAMVVAHLIFMIGTTLGWGFVGYALGVLKTRVGNRAASTREDDV